MTYSPILIVHICAGLIAMLAGFTALFVRKGSRLHRRSGDVFVVSMMAMAAGGAYLAMLKSQRMNVVAGVLTFYMVITAWLTVWRKERKAGLAELGLLFVVLAAGAGCFFFGWQAAHRVSGARAEGPVPMYFVFGTIALLSGAGDIRMLIRGSISRVQRLVRHLWRMCLALFLATASFFLGSASRTGLRARLFTAEIRKTYLPTVPVLVVLVLMIFWLFRVWFASEYRQRRAAQP